MKTSVLLSILFVLGLSNFISMALAQQIELELLQPDRVLGYEQLIPFRLVVTGQEENSKGNLLILREIPRNFSTIQPALEQSQKRSAVADADLLTAGFWQVFETRARQMGVTPEYQNPGFSPLAYHEVGKTGHVYDKENFENNIKVEDKNPVQSYLMEQMGMSAFPAQYLYQVSQYGYRQNGLEGAKLAYNDFFIRELDNEISSFAHRIQEFIEVKQMEAMLSFGDVNQMTIGESAVERFVAPLVDGFFTGTKSPSSAMVANVIRDSGVDYTDREAVKRMLIRTFTPLLDTGTSSVSQILMGRQGRIQAGIMKEREGGALHAMGPKSLQRKLNTAFIEIVRLQTLMGASFSQSYEFANFLAANHEYVLSYSDDYRSNQYRGIYSWLKADFESGAGLLHAPDSGSICSDLLNGKKSIH